MINGKEMEKNLVEIARKNCNDDWRSTLPTLIDRFKHVCLRDEFSDVDFVFNKGSWRETRIPAHACVLILASEVFEKLFVYDGRDKTEHKEILVNDTKLKADAVKILLKFIYNNFNFMDVTGINSASVWDVIYAAKMYMVPLLEKHCIDFLTKNLSAKNVLGVLDQCLQWEVNLDLLVKCKEMLQKQTNEVLKSVEFLGISQKCLIVLLEQEKLTATEGTLFKSALEWAKRACLSEPTPENLRLKICHSEPTPESLRNKLGPTAFSLIRFPIMSKEDFGKVVLPSNILSVQEVHDLLLMMTFGDAAPLKNPLPFSNTPRNDNSEKARIIFTNIAELAKEKVICHTSRALNMFGLATDEIAMYIEGLINRSYRASYGHCDCVIVDQTVSDDAFVKQQQNCYYYRLDFALRGLKIGLRWNGKRY